MGCHRKCLRNVLKFLVVLGCLGGFLYQTMKFMFFYWTYPTVVDIQVTSPSYIDMPAFTFCNHVGYNLDKFCEYSVVSCPERSLLKFAGICEALPLFCINDNLPSDLTIVTYSKFAQVVQFSPKVSQDLAMKLDEYLNCTIEFAGETRKCNLENIMGSFYSAEDLPHFCFTIYSKWGHPYKKQEKIEKGANMKFHFYLNITQRPAHEKNKFLRFNPPSTAAVQIAIHSPYYLPSPFLQGSGFIGGKSYEIQLKQEEKHLLPAPYQTNCTDYMAAWYARGGHGPLNQLMVVQECKLNHSYHTLGCIPLSIDYPHHYNICKLCGKTNDCKDMNFQADNCTLLAESYNQPCDFISYEVEINEKVITIPRNLKSAFTKDEEGIKEKKNAHDCSDQKIARPECSTVDVEVIFERFEITNLTYNPKYESMETFSVVGGYLGMWLGVSLVAVYDFLTTIFILIRNSIVSRAKNKRLRRKIIKQKSNSSNDLPFERKKRKLRKSVYDDTYSKNPSSYTSTNHY